MKYQQQQIIELENVLFRTITMTTKTPSIVIYIKKKIYSFEYKIIFATKKNLKNTEKNGIEKLISRKLIIVIMMICKTIIIIIINFDGHDDHYLD